MSLAVGLGGVARHACATLCTDKMVLGICEQERITRVRAAGVNRTGLPDEVLDELLRRSGKSRGDVTSYAVAEEIPGRSDGEVVRLDHHFAHACSAFLPSPFESATVVVCDREPPHVSVWAGSGNTITRIEWPWRGPGLAEMYSRGAQAFGFAPPGHNQRMEALARLASKRRVEQPGRFMTLDADGLSLTSDWRSVLEACNGVKDYRRRASEAAAFQANVGNLLIELLAHIQRRVHARGNLCLGGSLFHNSYLNAKVKTDSGYDAVFVPVNPGDAGLSVGAACYVNGSARHRVTPFLGPSYTQEEIKATLDNCKLTYRWVSDTDRIATAVQALKQGRLVAWFDGAAEWGPRALGARSILASPIAPYVLENLNRFLKHRDPWRGYAMSGLETAVHEHFDGPVASPYMECDYLAKDPGRFQAILPESDAAVRIQSVGLEVPAPFRTLLEAFGAATGLPFIVNTSFNGFLEPMVCSPRDAVRVFFGTGLDVLVLGQFVISK
jgi:carbamoyltransferase